MTTSVRLPVVLGFAGGIVATLGAKAWLWDKPGYETFGAVMFLVGLAFLFWAGVFWFIRGSPVGVENKNGKL